VAKGRVVMGLLFFPRGGSAQVARYLVPALEGAGWEAALVGGSLGVAGEGTHAPTFYGDIELHHLDFTAAVERFEAGGSAVDAPVPMHPSFEDREDAPDVVLSAVDPGLAGHLASVWEAPLAAAGAAVATVFHLHHLTQQHDAARQRWPSVPLVAHLHGTEIKFLEAVDERASVAAAAGTTLEAMPEAVVVSGGPPRHLDERQRDLWLGTRWEAWRHGNWWGRHLRRQAAAADHLVAVSPSDRESATSVLGVDASRVSEVPNGVDVERFRPRPPDPGARRDRFRRWLVEEPRGWDACGVPGSVAYREGDLDRLLGPDGTGTVLVFVGRFTSAKRVPVLVRAFARARARFERPASLLVWGGHPGEWEDEHPVSVAGEVGADGIFFAGWRGHDDLPDALGACDALVMPSVNDSYPQTPLEAMATGLPVVATRSGGFPSMVNVDPAEPTGWLVPPDDVDALAGALVEAVNRPDELARRGRAALAHARASFSWTGRVAGFERAYELAADHRARAARGA
jgi:glycosyltransferase involved in cell wall biosynthesis